MFTGLIETVGSVRAMLISDDGASRRIQVATPIGAELSPGESVAVNGVCLTAVDPDGHGFSADLSPETLRVTTLGALISGDRINLERAVRANARMGGHFLLGHVDTTAAIVTWEAQGDHWWLEVELPEAISRWVVDKGSIAVDGISLTIARLEPHYVGIQIVPHTRAHTNLADRRPGDRVNLEADIIGKYAARLTAMPRDADRT